MSNYVRYAKSRVSGEQTPNVDHVLPDILGIQYRMQDFDISLLKSEPEESKQTTETKPTPATKAEKSPSPKSTPAPKDPPAKPEPAAAVKPPASNPATTIIVSGKSGKNKKNKQK